MELFRRLLDRLRCLLRQISQCKRLSLFCEFIQSSLENIESVQSSNVNLLDESSICDGKKVLLTIKDKFNKKFDQAEINPSKSKFDRVLNESCKNTLREIRFLLSTLYRYQMKIYHDKQDNISNY